jgi:hypothetical protein
MTPSLQNGGHSWSGILKISCDKAASVGVRNLPLAVAGFASEGIDFAVRLYRLHHHGEARSIARNARMLFDLASC